MEKINETELPSLPTPTIQWTGDPIETMPPASSLLAADQQVFTAQEENEALFFYDGDQWLDHVKHERLRHGRPCLVVNRIPALVAAAISKDPEFSLKPGRCYSGHQEEQLTRLKVITVRRNMDAQRVYNYMVSCAAELAALEVERARHPQYDPDAK